MRCTFSFAVVSVLATATARSLPLESTKDLLRRAPAEWTYHGCWTDEGDRQLGGASYHGDDMTPGICISFCESRGYSFAGLEYARECFCGYNLKSQSTMRDDEECNMACSGDSEVKCGGPNRLSVYTSGTPTQIVTNPGPINSGWTYKSCYEDSVYARTLGHKADTPGGNSVLACTSACKNAGYKFAGVEWTSECFCDNTINFDRPGDLEGCDMVCEGNQLEYCGGAQKLNVYEFEPLPGSSTTTTPMASSSITSTTTTTTPSTTSSSISTTVTTTTTEPVLTTTSESSVPASSSSTTLQTSTTTMSTSSIVPQSSSTVLESSTVTTSNAATCISTPTVSIEQQAKDAAALEFLQQNNRILKMLRRVSFKELANNTIGPIDGDVLGPIYTAIQNWVPCTTDQPDRWDKVLECGNSVHTRVFLSCIVYWTSPAAYNRFSSVPTSSVNRLYVNHREGTVPGTGEPLITSDMDIVTYLELRYPERGIARDNSNVLYYFGESHFLSSG